MLQICTVLCYTFTSDLHPIRIGVFPIISNETGRTGVKITDLPMEQVVTRRSSTTGGWGIPLKILQLLLHISIVAGESQRSSWTLDASQTCNSF